MDFHAREAEGKKIIEALSRLKYEMARDRPLEWVILAFQTSVLIGDRRVPDDGEAMVDVYNRELDSLTADGKGTWFTAPWLFAEYVETHIFYHWIRTDRLTRCYLFVTTTFHNNLC